MARMSALVSFCVGVSLLGFSYKWLKDGNLLHDWSYPAMALKASIALVAVGFVFFPISLLFRGSADRKRALDIAGKKMQSSLSAGVAVVQGKRG